MSRNKFYFVIFLLVCAIGFSGCADKSPVSNLSDGRDGKIYFYSTNATFKEYINNQEAKEKIAIHGFLSLPKNISGKVPAVVILHGIGGVAEDIPKDHFNEIADILNEIGIAAFIVDSQTPRKVIDMTQLFEKVTISMRVADAYAALHLLSTHPQIDKDKIGAIGFSRGGNVAMLAQSKLINKSLCEKDNLKFAAVVALYPSCVLQLSNIDFLDSPILMLLAEKDNITPTPMALKYVQRIKSTGANLEFKVYENALHAFDFKILAGKKVNWFNDLSGCQDRYFLLENDGMLFSPYFNERNDDFHKFKNAFTDCEKWQKGLLGGPKEARERVIEDYKAFFTRVFRLS